MSSKALSVPKLSSAMRKIPKGPNKKSMMKRSGTRKTITNKASNLDSATKLTVHSSRNCSSKRFRTISSKKKSKKRCRGGSDYKTQKREMMKSIQNSDSFALNGSCSSKTKTNYSKIDNDSFKNNSAELINAHGIPMHNLRELSLTDNGSLNNVSRDVRVLDTSKDISINDCIKFSDPNLSSIEQPNTLNIQNQANMFRNAHMIGSSQQVRDTLEKVNNTYTYDSNQSLGVCSSGTAQNPIRIEDIPSSGGKLNNTGKFAMINPLMEEAELKLGRPLLDDAKNVLNAFNKTMGSINDLLCSRWEDLRQKFISTCNNFQTDEIINIMLDDTESQKYVAQRMEEILSEDWAAEREATINQLTKQIGMLEMKNNLFSSQFDPKNCSISEANKMKVLQDLLDSKHSEVNSLQKNLSIKNKEISMLRAYQEGRSKKAGSTQESLNLEYKRMYESVIAEKEQLQNLVTSLQKEVGQREHSLQRFEQREKELRESISKLESKVNELTKTNVTPINSESAIQMFHKRIRQLEEDRDNNSDEEKELARTKNKEETENYIKKLKNTLKIYKSRSKDFEKRSIELECINIALQKELSSAQASAQKVQSLESQLSELQQSHLLQTEQFKQSTKDLLRKKKQKYITKIKNLEQKFIDLCEAQMSSIQENLKNKTEHELGSELMKKELELQSLQQRVDEEYILVTEHEEIVNDLFEKEKDKRQTEIEQLCDNFEKEFIQAQEVTEEERIKPLEQQVKEEREHRDCLDKRVLQLETELAVCKENLNDVKAENSRCAGDLSKAYQANSVEISNYEADISKLHHKLTDKEKELHKLEMKVEKYQTATTETEKSTRNKILLLENTVSSMKSKHKQAEESLLTKNTDLTQQVLALKDELSNYERELDKNRAEFDTLIEKYEDLSTSHQCLAKENNDAEEYITSLKSQLQKFKTNRRNLAKDIKQAVGVKCTQMREELTFLKKLVSEEIKFMYKYADGNYNDVCNEVKKMINHNQEVYLNNTKTIELTKEKQYQSEIQQMKQDFVEKLHELNDKCDEAQVKEITLKKSLDEQKADNTELANQVEDLKSIVSIKELSMEKLKAKMKTCEDILERYFASIPLENTSLEDFSNFDLSVKLTKLNDMTKQLIEKHKQEMDTLNHQNLDQLESTKQSYEQRIESLYIESETKDTQISDLKDTNLDLSQSLAHLEEQMSSAYDQISKILLSHNIGPNSEERIDDKIYSLSLIIIEKEQALQKYKEMNSQKEEEITKLTQRSQKIIQESLRREEIIKENTQKVLQESNNLLMNKRQMNDENTKSLQRLLNKLEIKQNERSLERSSFDRRDRMSPIRSKASMELIDEIKKAVTPNLPRGKSILQDSPGFGSFPPPPITGKENISKMNLSELNSEK
ncbi:unnamed protein product [Moneuplotes crassus]|uniref:Uncharacterized protein n=1 Tax=Euplotes crassus TaxID=5936 RepID=A0AAD1U8Z9_EUPCR|nr:unnamed protein product [Moneuplotes crassus]